MPEADEQGAPPRGLGTGRKLAQGLTLGALSIAAFAWLNVREGSLGIMHPFSLLALAGVCLGCRMAFLSRPERTVSGVLPLHGNHRYERTSAFGDLASATEWLTVAATVAIVAFYAVALFALAVFQPR